MITNIRSDERITHIETVPACWARRNSSLALFKFNMYYGWTTNSYFQYNNVCFTTNGAGTADYCMLTKDK